MESHVLKDLISMPLEELMGVASAYRRSHAGNRVDTCGIVNAKSGRCAEDCKFCPQSVHHDTGVTEYPLKNSDELFREAVRAKNNGAKRFGIVTSGNRLTAGELAGISEAVGRISKELGMAACASLGALSGAELEGLKKAGLTRYHHNIETSRGFYPKIVSTHVFDERISTVKAAKSAGLEVCSGGIIGLGESWDDRIDMALTLKALDVDAVPLNFLIPVKGTPLEGASPLSAADALRTIAVFRVILGGKDIKVCAGRESVLKDHQEGLFMAGANGIMVGGYLTTRGRYPEEDIELIRKVEYSWKTG